MRKAHHSITIDSGTYKKSKKNLKNNYDPELDLTGQQIKNRKKLNKIYLYRIAKNQINNCSG